MTQWQEDKVNTDEVQFLVQRAMDVALKLGGFKDSTAADLDFGKAVADVILAQVLDGKTRYGDEWYYGDPQPHLAAVFGLHKFAARLYKSLLTREISVPTGDKLRSDVKDAAIFALFLLATIGKIDWSLYANKPVPKPAP